MVQTAPFGSWSSELSAHQVATAKVRLAEPYLDAGRCFWLKPSAAEKGRVTIVMAEPGGAIKEILPAPWSARSKVHEYGGGAYLVTGEELYFVNAQCQQIYHLNMTTGSVSELTQDPSWRYGGLALDKTRNRLLAVAEQHRAEGEPVNCLVAIDLQRPKQTLLASGHDFYAQPALSADGQQLAFIAWDHPNMPWDKSRVHLLELDAPGATRSITPLSDGKASVFQPQWLDADTLIWVDDSSGWWNLQQFTLGSRELHPVATMAAEFALPLWTLDMKTFGVLDATTLLASYNLDNRWHTVLLHQEQPSQWRVETLAAPFSSIQGLCVAEGQAAAIASASESAPGIWRWQGGHWQPLLAAAELLPANDIAKGQPFAFPSGAGDTAYANFYPPTNSRFQGLSNDLPPAIFIGHGGPTAQADLGLDLKIQFWTQRGFAVVDVNYRGSTGFGRAYREQLKYAWGEADGEDVGNAARFAQAQGRGAPDKCFIRASSAGGFTVLAALTKDDTFKAGVSLYGIGDLETLVADTHKFESRYLDSLIGPYPEQQAVYRERSPIHKVDRIRCPLLVFQGLEDKVVPPSQAETLVAALRSRGLPVTYVTYPDEAHGFRQAETVVHQLETELAFYRDLIVR